MHFKQLYQHIKSFTISLEKMEELLEVRLMTETSNQGKSLKLTPMI
ncbi:MAG: hypothetical protein ACXAEU_19080 [Candidatus Hodarchaeales archaeon]